MVYMYLDVQLPDSITRKEKRAGKNQCRVNVKQEPQDTKQYKIALAFQSENNMGCLHGCLI